jgi:hypothetical protein
MERKHEVEAARHGRAELARAARLLLDAVAVRVATDAPLALECDAVFLEGVTSFVADVLDHLTHCALEERTRDTDRPPPAEPERCLVCGHFHGGQGSCVTAHAFVAMVDCPTCVAHGAYTVRPAGEP